MSGEKRPGIGDLRKIITSAILLVIVGWWDGHGRSRPGSGARVTSNGWPPEPCHQV